MRASLLLVAASVALLSSACGSSGPSPHIRRGAQVFASSFCLTCHTYAGVGTRKLGAPDLTREGDRDRGETWQVRHLRDPRAVVPGSKMPPLQGLTRGELDALVAFLEGSKGQWRASDLWLGSGVS